jgi:hypothetical protein
MFCFPVLQILSWLCTTPAYPLDLTIITPNTFYEQTENTKNTVNTFEYSLNITYQSSYDQDDIELGIYPQSKGMTIAQIHAKNLKNIKNARLNKKCKNAIKEIKTLFPTIDFDDVD